MTVVNGCILPMDGPEILRGFVSFKGGKITAVGSMEDYTAGDEDILDAKGDYILPGLLDIHCHLGMFSDGLTYEYSDANEMSAPCTPHLRGIDGLNPQDPTFGEALRGGVTTVVTGPGSGNPIGGQLAAVKTQGRWADEMVLQAPLAMKFALGENPKRIHGSRKQSPVTRMATAALIREQLCRALEYGEKRSRGNPPDYDPQLEALLPVAQGELPAHFHAHRADDIATALRITREFGLKTTIVHGTEGYLVADLLAEAGVGVIVGPIISDRSKPELSRLTVENAGRLAEAGIPVAICTDHPETPIQYLTLTAAVAARGGLSPADALAAITSTAARLAGLDHRVGSLTPGKDADITLWEGHPLQSGARLRAVYLDGKAVRVGD